DLLSGIGPFRLATGPDGLGNQAVYLTYVQSTLGVGSVEVTGSNDGAMTFTAPVAVSDAAHVIANPDVAVGSHGELFVSWFDLTDLAVRSDHDLDGLFVGGNTFGADVTVVDNSTIRPGMATNFNLFFNQLTPATPDHGISSAPVMDVDH